MEWKKFTELNIEYPEKVIQNKIEGFDIATDNRANLELIKADGIQSLRISLPGSFKFSLFLTSPFLKNYRFEILSFSYDIKFMPVHISIEDSIDNEIFGENYSFEPRAHIANSNEEFKQILDLIFGSSIFETIVGGIIKISRNYEY